MRINTDESIKTGKAIHEKYGSWGEAKKAAKYEDGKYKIRED